MNITSTMTPSLTDAAAWRRRIVRTASIGILAASAINVGLFAIGRAGDASFLMEAAYGTPAHQVTTPDVALKTLIPLAIGVVMLAFIARRSSRWFNHVTVAGAGLGIFSGVLAGLRAHDVATSLLIVSMHAVASVSFWLIARRLGTMR